jgi:tripartite-type tricarboxylate transporter receptor subunit TctC
MPLHRRALLSGASLAVCAPGLVRAQSDSVVRLIVPYAPGGGTDTSGRILAERLTHVLGEQVVVDNRPGGGTIVGTEIVATAKQDGRTLLLAAGVIAINAAFDLRTPYDPVRDLVPVSSYVELPLVLASNNEAPFTTMSELIAHAKRQREGVSFASAGNGSITHLWGEQIASVTGMKLEHIPYKGSADAMKDVMGGHVGLFPDVLMPAGLQVKNGKLRGLLVSSPQRPAMLPDVPTVVEAGLPTELELMSFFGIMTTAGSPAGTVSNLNKAINQVLAEPETRSKLSELGFVTVGGTPGYYGQKIARETVRFRKIIRDCHIPAPV